MKQSGFTIIEALMAVAVLGIIVAGIVPAYSHYSQLNTRSELKSSAAAMAQEQMEKMRRLDFSMWEASGHTETKSMGGREFTMVVSHSQYKPDDGTTISGAKKIHTKISSGDRLIYEVTTIYTQLD